MSVSAIALSAYLVLLGESIQDDSQLRMALNETPLVINYQDTHIPYKHRQWRVLDQSVCERHDQNSTEYSDCTLKAKSLFSQICSALSNQASNYWHHQKYKEMYCNAAVNFQPMVATISYGNSTQITPEEKKCNQLILKALVDKDGKSINERDEACKLVPQSAKLENDIPY